MKLFLYSKWISLEPRKRQYVDFMLFTGEHLDKRGNHRFKIYTSIFSMSDKRDGEILECGDKEEVEELNIVDNLQLAILRKIFSDRSRISKN